MKRLVRSRWFIGYVALLLLSHAVVWLRSGPGVLPAPSGAERLNLRSPAMDDAGPAAGWGEIDVSLLRWKGAAHSAAGADRAAKPPFVLLHGSPSGGGSDFSAFAPLLASAGHDVIAIDLPGSGGSAVRTASYSILANARVALAVMESLGIPRAHVLGWSQGGGSAIHMAVLAPERVASLTMLGSIGAQETEGSGDYWFEHLKYRLGQGLIVWAPELLPHFGLLGERARRAAFLRSFVDTDQRPMAGLLRELRTPTLILHGRDDLLVQSWAAEVHHQLIEPSTLVMLKADHFIPMGQPPGNDAVREEAARHVLAFAGRHNAPGVAPLRGAAVFAPARSHAGESLGGFELNRSTRWWVIILIITAATFVSEDLTIITVGLLIVNQSVDWGVAVIGCFVAIVIGDLALWALGRFVGRRVLRWPVIRNVVTDEGVEKWGRLLDQHTGKAVLLSRCLPGTRMPTFIAAGIFSRKAHHFFFWVGVAAFLWAPFLLLMTVLIGPSLLAVFETVFHGPFAIVAAVVAVFLIIRLVGYETTAQGRDRVKADLKRIIAREFWPLWLFYLPLVPGLLWMALRHRGPLTFTCANPGIEKGGGMVGESKARILRSLESAGAPVLPFALIEAEGSAERRAEQALGAIRERPELGGFPVILKPDKGCRGHGLKLARSESDVRAYFRANRRAVIVQAFHAGPHEIGVLWARVPRASSRADEWSGEVLSVTAKTFPVVEGDGLRTLERLIWDHPRYRMQASVFLKRFEGQSDRVPALGERVALALAGNHCQGAMFTDGMLLVSHALAERIDALGRAFRNPENGRGLDFGRFDLRYASEDELHAGRGFAIVELNGTSSESTSVYDPTKNIWWCYGLLYRHWWRLFALGAARRREGARPMTLRELVGEWRRERRRGSGSPISD